ncbi:DUF2290 domain-containing protein [Paenarthrobacter sp. NPDC089316]|uniref:DUF2290 domain-containing protein n=1 Tax=unclassified Paenarthrobacter TaxID=2634190 RepID=UPI00341E7F54
MPSLPNAQKVLKDLKVVVRHFNTLGIADQSFDPILLNTGKNQLVQSPVTANSAALENIPYDELYQGLDTKQAFLIKLIDGGLMQFDYCFDQHGRRLEKHRLAYLPAPHLDPYMSLENDYWEGRAFLEVVGHQVVPVPLRVDYDSRPDVAVSVIHPAAHLTLGQYKHCRIPISSPMLPMAFAVFIGTHFYSQPGASGFSSLGSSIPGEFADSITEEEMLMTHIRV